MKAISLWQPWASLWLSDRKIYETRDWCTAHRGPLLVHAAQRFERNIPSDDPLRRILDDQFGGYWATLLPTGALIGAVDLVACLRTENVYAIPLRPEAAPDDFLCGDFTPNRFAWQRGAFHRFAQPIPWKGKQGFFNVPLEVVAPQLADAASETLRMVRA